MEHDNKSVGLFVGRRGGGVQEYNVTLSKNLGEVALVTNVDFYIVSFRISLGKSGWT
jgi:hypothetical protein